MAFHALRSLLGSLSLLVLSACATLQSTSAAPTQAFAPIATDLGGSSRVRYVTALAGEGEGFSTPRPSGPSVHASMPGMDHGAPSPAPSSHAGHAAPPPTAQAPSSHADHGAMPGHGPFGRPRTQTAQAAHVEGTGTVNSVDTTGHKVNLNHNPIPAIGWPAMTMDFAVALSVNLGTIKPGTRVSFMLQRGGDGMYVIHSIAPAGGGRP